MKNEAQEYLLKDLVRYLLLNNDNEDIGLYHGKMGLVICLCEYGRYLHNFVYTDIAIQWLDDILLEIHASLPVDMEVGLCGLGVGFDYVVRHGYLVGDIDEILSDFDKYIMERDIRRITDYSLERGLGGIAYYVITRLSLKRSTKSYAPFDFLYLSDLKEAIMNSNLSNDKNLVGRIFNCCLHLINQKKAKFDYSNYEYPALLSIAKGIDGIDINQLHQYPKGLDEGIAGTILTMIHKEKYAYLYS